MAVRKRKYTADEVKHLAGDTGRRSEDDDGAKVRCSAYSTLYTSQANSQWKKRTHTARTSTTTDRRITRKLAKDLPCHAVLATTELIELILSHALTKSVASAQRVCRYFRDVVARSGPLNERVLLWEPALTNTEQWTVVHDSNDGSGYRVVRYHGDQVPARRARSTQGGFCRFLPAALVNPLFTGKGCK